MKIHSINFQNLLFKSNQFSFKAATCTKNDKVIISTDSIIARLSSETLPEGYLMDAFKVGKLTKEDILKIAISAAGKIPDVDLKYFSEKMIPLTEVDNKYILLRRKKNLSVKQVDENNPIIVENKQKIIDAQLTAIDKTPKNKKMIIIIGLSASGKSKIIDTMYKDDYYVADTDNIKKILNKYKDGMLDNSHHNISREILQKEIIPHTLNVGANIIIPTTGLSEYVVRLSEPAKKLGYEVELIYNKIDKKIAMDRCLYRFKEEGRFVDPYFIASREPFMEQIPDDFNNSPLIDHIKIIDFSKDYRNLTPEEIKEEIVRNTQIIR